MRLIDFTALVFAACFLILSTLVIACLFELAYITFEYVNARIILQEL